MSNNLVDVLLHTDENTTHELREMLREKFLQLTGVNAASYHDEKPHLMIIVYDPEIVKANEFTRIAQDN